MIVSIHQPDYIPYLGYFYKMSLSDVFVFLDDAQFSNDNMHHWNRIKTPQGECRLKIPVEQHFGDPLNVVRTKDELGWKHRHLQTLRMNYTKAPYYAQYVPTFTEILLSKYDCLSALNREMNTWIARQFGISARLVNASDMGIETRKEERVLDIVDYLGGDTYLSGRGAEAYQQKAHFDDRGIELVYSEYQPIAYPQLWPRIGFLPKLSVVDYIFNCGFDWDFVERAIEGYRHGNR